MKHSFQEVEECANERLKEELSFDILNSIKRSREGEGILTLGEIAKIVSEAVGDDAKTLAGLMYVINRGEQKKDSYVDNMLSQQKYAFGEINKAFGLQ